MNTIRELFEGHPERWIKGAFAQSAGGIATSRTSESAARWCLDGAMYKVYPIPTLRYNAMVRLMRALPAGFISAGCFNDNKATTFDDVMRVLRKANI